MLLVSRRFALETKRLIHLAWPLLIAQITQMLMGVSDTVMAGRYGAVDMAAVALGFSVTIPLLCFLQGLAFALPPFISRLQGKRALADIPQIAQQSAYSLVLVSFPMLLLYPFADTLVGFFPMEAALFDITVEYTRYVILAMPAFALYQWLRNYCEGLGSTKPTMLITVIGLMVNILANYLLIYGIGPFPEMGGAGCGVATALVFYAMLIATFVYTLVSPKIKKYALFSAFYKPELHILKRIFKLGLPIAMTLLFEVTLFAVVALLLTPFGAITIAAHQVALNFSSLMFMFPLSMGMAVAIRISYRMGQQRVKQARTVVKSALTVGLSIAFATASFTILAKSFIIGLYTTDQQVFTIASSLLIYAALFQFSDAIQVISANALRGYKDTTAMFYITFFAYWVIGLPVGIILARTNWITAQPLSAAGFWIGFICGLSTAAVMLGARVRYIQKQYASGERAFSTHLQ
ncbi:MATE family efflux transporter [Alteromonas sp. ASW11-130]|uniref:MATE family efflux transporter n=1 Tax=Alteromonas sp. ASW11-130 TaxID=3015775 RepID=UPI0022418BF1|nr:MATE family efflux transporter [Alteromonas sp. ASW11-130]MCW8092443.1 MATE family efflux transporter [Alteromonas sp. ASW11-130]